MREQLRDCRVRYHSRVQMKSPIIATRPTWKTGAQRATCRDSGPDLMPARAARSDRSARPVPCPLWRTPGTQPVPWPPWRTSGYRLLPSRRAGSVEGSRKAANTLSRRIHCWIQPPPMAAHEARPRKWRGGLPHGGSAIQDMPDRDGRKSCAGSDCFEARRRLIHQSWHWGGRTLRVRRWRSYACMEDVARAFVV